MTDAAATHHAENTWRLRTELLESSRFRIVLGQYHCACLELEMRNLFFVPAKEGEYFYAGQYKVNKADFQNSLFVLAGIPPDVKCALTEMVASSLNDASILHIFHLLEEDTENAEEAPPSIKHVLARLRLPENMERIEQLVGNAEQVLAELDREYKDLWDNHGSHARRQFRNIVAHGRVSMFEQMETPVEDRDENKAASLNFYAAADGIYDILNDISRKCFGVSTDLPGKDKYWHAFWNEIDEEQAWCFDYSKYPTKELRPIDTSDLVLTEEDFRDSRLNKM